MSNGTLPDTDRAISLLQGGGPNRAAGVAVGTEASPAFRARSPPLCDGQALAREASDTQFEQDKLCVDDCPRNDLFVSLICSVVGTDKKNVTKTIRQRKATYISRRFFGV